MAMLLPESRRLEFTEIEAIDIGIAVGGHEAEGVVRAVERACTEAGFFYITSHGVAPELIAQLHAHAATFFDLPMEQRMAIRMGANIRGYLPLNYRSKETDSQAGTNLQEGFWMGHERPLDPKSPFDGPNIWPAGCPGLKPAMEAYFVALESLALVLRRLFALALGVEAARFDRLFDHPQFRLKLNHYPPQESPESVDEIGVVPHTDTGAYTILWQDESGGLEIENKAGEWVEVPPIPGSFVINLGNMMQALSAGRFSSTPHRVVNRSGGERYSIPFFANPGHDAIIEPVVDGESDCFEPFSFGTYQQNEYRGVYPVAFDE
jgi:isopenicillin N synthase-like dioxygenase